MFEEPSGFMTEENCCKMHGTGPKRHEVLLPSLHPFLTSSLASVYNRDPVGSKE